MGPPNIESNVLEASERRSAGERDHRNTCQCDQGARQLGLHGRAYQGLLYISGLTPTPPLGPPRPSLREHEEPTGIRSVALLAQPHPKCPISGGASTRPRYLTVLPSTGVLRSSRDYMDAGVDRSIRHLTYPYRSSRL